MNSRAHVFIYGDVINVGFRAWTLRNAREKQLTGWVRNVYHKQGRRVGDNCVEAVFEGEKKKIEEMVTLCHKGPEVSWVERVEIKWEKETLEFKDFDIV